MLMSNGFVVKRRSDDTTKIAERVGFEQLLHGAASTVFQGRGRVVQMKTCGKGQATSTEPK